VAEQWKRRYFVRAFVISAFALGFSSAASAGTVSLDLGALSIPSANNEFLLEFGLDGSGMEIPNEVFLNNGSTYSYSSNTMSYSQASNPAFTFDFSFSVDSLATLSQNPIYAMFLGSGTSSIELMQGSSVVDKGVLTAGPGSYYSLPSVTLLPDTRYDLVVTTLGVPVSLNPGYAGREGWGQIPVDISAAAPEPMALPLLSIAVLGIAGFSFRRGVHRLDS
jgi:hypothetical protein